MAHHEPASAGVGSDAVDAVVARARSRSVAFRMTLSPWRWPRPPRHYSRTGAAAAGSKAGISGFPQEKFVTAGCVPSGGDPYFGVDRQYDYI
jgi:hypothetical protein